MAFTTLDKQLIYSGLTRQSGGSLNAAYDLLFQFFNLATNQQENQIRAEALLEYNELQADIASLQTKITALQAQAAILLARSEGNQ